MFVRAFSCECLRVFVRVSVCAGERASLCVFLRSNVRELMRARVLSRVSSRIFEHVRACVRACVRVCVPMCLSARKSA